MNTVAFDAVARRAAEAVSRRGALLALAGAGLSGVIAHPMLAAAKKKKAKKKGNTGCQRQGGQCLEWLEAFCEDEECDPEGEEQFVLCCQVLGQCNAYGFLECITSE